MRKKLFVLFLVATFLLFGCFEKEIKDTPAQRNLLAMEIAQLCLNNGGYDAMVKIGVIQGLQVFASQMQVQMGRELTQSEFEKFSQAFKEAFIKTYPSSLWEGPMSEMYAKNFDSSELDQLLKFYKTPAGVKFLKTQERMSSEGAEMGVKLVQSHQEEFGKTFDAEVSKRFR